MKISLMHEADTKLSGSTAHGSKKNQPAKEQTAEEKKVARTKELLKEVQIVRSLPFAMVVKTRFNLPEEVEMVKKEAEVVIDPKKKK